MINIKRIQDGKSLSDGYRIFVDRLYPRGIRKEDFDVDLWAKDIATSTELRQWFHEDPVNRYKEFTEKYLDELDKNPYSEKFLSIVNEHKVITLISDRKDVEHSQVPVIKSFIEQKLKLR